MRYLLVLFLMGSSIISHAQLSTTYVENWINSCEPEGGLDSLEWLYIINGVPFDEPEEKLNSFDTKNQLWFIDYVYSDSVDGTFFNPGLLIILIGSSPKLKKEERAENLKEQQVKFTDDSDEVLILHRNPTDPALIIDGELISPEKAKEKIYSLREKNVRYIQYVNHIPYAFYGTRAKNGMVTIWTRGYRP